VSDMEDGNSVHHVVLHKAKREKKVWYKRVWLWFVVGFVLLCIGAASTGGNTDMNNGSSTGSGTSLHSVDKAGTLSGSASGGDNAGTLSSPTTTTTAPYTVGDTITLDSLAVKLDSVIDPATGADEYNTPNAGDKFVAVDFTITNNGSQTYSDDANTDVSVIGSDTQDYSPDFDNVSECTNFNDGSYDLAPGDTESGCVVFQLPQSVSVSKVQFVDDNSKGGEWTVK
jgi:hypothetical protein